MKTVILMRHAKAAEHADGRDFDRPLTDSGRQMATETARLLLEEGLTVDGVICSSAVRTQQTARAVATVLCPDARVVTLDELYLSPPVACVSAVRQYATDDDQSILLVGHNPGMACLMHHWSGRTFAVPPCTVVVFELDLDEWDRLPTSVRQPFAVRCLIREGALCEPGC